jgi:hypothetical protein
VPDIRRADNDADPPPPAEALTSRVGVMGPSPTHAQSAAVDPLRAARVRLCVLCGGPLRAGQRVTRVQGSTIHVRCGNGAR